MSLDLGPTAWQRLAAEAPDELYAARAEPISFLAPHLRMLTWTSPRPTVGPTSASCCMVESETAGPCR